MSYLARLTAVVLTTILVTSMVPASAGPITAPTSATGTMAGTADMGTDTTQEENTTQVDSCRSLTEPGHYELTTDLESDDTCISIGASNVTFDGNGHTVAADGSRYGSGVTIGGDNVTVMNLTVADFDSGIGMEQVDNVTVTDSRVVNGSISVLGAHDLVIADTTLEDSRISLKYAVDSLVTGVDGDGAEVGVDDSIDVTVRDSKLHRATFDQSVAVTIANNSPDDTGSFAVELQFMHNGRNQLVVHNNTITGNTGDTADGIGLRVTSVHNLSITDNRIVGNDEGIRIWAVRDWDCIPGSVEIHGNSLANNSDYGVEYLGESGVDATDNYWGPAGPSSPTSQPLEDPETGELADGDGSAVSQRSDDEYVSNVRFDPWLDEDPTDVPENESN